MVEEIIHGNIEVSGKMNFDGNDLGGIWTMMTAVEKEIFPMIMFYFQKNQRAKKEINFFIPYYCNDYKQSMNRLNPNRMDGLHYLVSISCHKEKGIRSSSGYSCVEISYVNKTKPTLVKFSRVKDEACQSFLKEWERIVADTMIRQLASARFYKAMHDGCRTGGFLEIIPFVEEFQSDLALIDRCIEGLHGEQNWVTDVEDMISLNIEGKFYDGFIDRKEHKYTDKLLVTKTQKIINIDIDFNSIIDQLGSKGIQLQAIQCPQCGHACDVPSSGSLFKCPACGAIIKATDMIEKFKGLLS
ncbi:MAG: hypothetical protein GYA18_09845 [Chloroflexi bacterium]|nr:hypothetical protein [Chloroflexota bacterium]